MTFEVQLALWTRYTILLGSGRMFSALFGSSSHSLVTKITVEPCSPKPDFSLLSLPLIEPVGVGKVKNFSFSEQCSTVDLQVRAGAGRIRVKEPRNRQRTFVVRVARPHLCTKATCLSGAGTDKVSTLHMWVRKNQYCTWKWNVVRQLQQLVFQLALSIFLYFNKTSLLLIKSEALAHLQDYVRLSYKAIYDKNYVLRVNIIRKVTLKRVTNSPVFAHGSGTGTWTGCRMFLQEILQEKLRGRTMTSVCLAYTRPGPTCAAKMDFLNKKVVYYSNRPTCRYGWYTTCRDQVIEGRANLSEFFIFSFFF